MRHDRQQRIPNWVQENLTRARVFVIGSGYLAQLVAAGLAALGVGTLRVIDNARFASGKEHSLLRLIARRSGESRTSALARLLSKINPEINTGFYHFPVLYEECLQPYPVPSVIIEATHDAGSKYACLRFARQRWVSTIFATAGPTDGRLAVYTPWQEVPLTERDYCMPEYHHQPQGLVPALVITGLALEEVRKLLLRLNENDRPLDRVLIYNRQSPNRFDAGKHFAISADANYGGHVVMVGAGALGNFLGLTLSSVRKLTVIDFDRVEPTNLNRQILFYDAIGEYKAQALVEKLRRIKPDIEYEAIVARVDEGFFQGRTVDLICSCVDNFEARLLLHRVAIQKQIPLINGGTSAFGGRMALFKPGQTACLQCQLNLEQWAQFEQERQIPRQGCVHVPEPSVVISNMVIAGLMAAEAGTVLNPKAYGPPIKGVIEYSALHPVRVGLRSLKEPCRCYEELSAVSNKRTAPATAVAES